MEIRRIERNDPLWNKTIQFTLSSTWEAKEHLAKTMENNNCFTGWESVFIATDGNDVFAHCTLLKEDYYPENRYFPWISTIFVDERHRGQRISQALIEHASAWAKANGFSKIYIPSGISGLYEKYGFTRIDELENYGGDMDAIFMKEI